MGILLFRVNISSRERLYFNFAKLIISRINDYEISLVGGANRELLLRYFNGSSSIIHDLDFTVFKNDGSGLTSSEFKEFSNRFKYMDDVILVDDGLKFLHFCVIGKKGTKFHNIELEFGTPRKEEYYDTRKPDISVGNVSDDIQRRDFTVNSIYTIINRLEDEYVVLEQHPLLVDIQNGFISDVKYGVLRTTSNNPMVIFNEDPLRILRAIRFGSFYKEV